MRKINDFGEKIGGSKKDLWARLRELNDAQKSELAFRDNLWKRPNYQSLSKDIPREVLFWQNEVRKSVVLRPRYGIDGYIQFVADLRERVEACKSMSDIRDFYKKDIFEFLVKDEVDETSWSYRKPEYADYFDGNVLLRYVRSGKRIISDCDQKGFLSSRSDKEARKYEVLKVTADILRSEPDENMFRNYVTLPNMSLMVRDMQDWTQNLSSDGLLLVVIYDKAQKIGLCYTNEEAEDIITSDMERRAARQAARKEAFLPPHLSNIQRTGSSYEYFRMSDPSVLAARYGLRGGEFGNYETSKDRLGSLNMAYDAFEDLAGACGISCKDIGLGGQLAMAFGARGRGNALAHYEAQRNVINITRHRGAGSLAHEWGHALDMYLGNLYGCPGFVSNNVDSSGVPEEVRALVRSMIVQNGSETEFSKNSKDFDKSYKKAGNGYWSSLHEMFARAFACFVRDQLGDYRSDYLVGHSEYAVSGNGTCAFPVGKEREEIDRRFRDLFSMLLEKGVFSPASAGKNRKDDPEDNAQDEDALDVFLFTGEDGQMKFC